MLLAKEYPVALNSDNLLLWSFVFLRSSSLSEVSPPSSSSFFFSPASLPFSLSSSSEASASLSGAPNGFAVVVVENGLLVEDDAKDPRGLEDPNDENPLVPRADPNPLEDLGRPPNGEALVLLAKLGFGAVSVVVALLAPEAKDVRPPLPAAPNPELLVAPRALKGDAPDANLPKADVSNALGADFVVSVLPSCDSLFSVDYAALAESCYTSDYNSHLIRFFLVTRSLLFGFQSFRTILGRLFFIRRLLIRFLAGCVQLIVGAFLLRRRHFVFQVILLLVCFSIVGSGRLAIFRGRGV